MQSDAPGVHPYEPMNLFHQQSHHLQILWVQLFPAGRDVPPVHPPRSPSEITFVCHLNPRLTQSDAQGVRSLQADETLLLTHANAFLIR